MLKPISSKIGVVRRSNIYPKLCMERREQPNTEGEQVLTIRRQDNWMTPIIHFLKEAQLSKDKTEAWKIQIRVACLVIVDDILYRRHSLLYLWCVNTKEANYVLREIHEGVCKNHAEARSLAGKALRAGYYWLTLQKDAHDLVKASDQYQHFAHVQTRPRELMTIITAPWPFTQWRINIMGPLLIGRKLFEFLIVAIDYFTKWVEAKSEVTIMRPKS